MVCLFRKSNSKAESSNAIEIELIVEKDGKVIEKRTEKGNTYLMNYINIIKSLVSEGLSLGVLDVNTGYSIEIIDLKTSDTGANAPEGDDSYGIQVGSSDTANTDTTYKLGSKIPHGTTSGRLVYKECRRLLDEGTFPTIRVVTERRFENATASPITVREIGLVCKFVTTTGLVHKAMIARDVLTSPVSVPANGALIVRYKQRVN